MESFLTVVKLLAFATLCGGLLCWFTQRLSGDRRLCAVVGASFVARTLLAVALFAISYYQWPVLRSLNITCERKALSATTRLHCPKNCPNREHRLRLGPISCLKTCCM